MCFAELFREVTETTMIDRWFKLLSESEAEFYNVPVVEEIQAEEQKILKKVVSERALKSCRYMVEEIYVNTNL